MDFTALVDNCAHFVESLIETEDPALWLTLCGRHCTAATHADLIPPHFTESLLSDTLPPCQIRLFLNLILVRILPRAGCASSPLFDKRRQR